MKVTLYKQDVSGVIRVWNAQGIVEGGEGFIEISYGQLNGVMQSQVEYIEKGKASRTLKEQVMSRLASRIVNRRDQGYVNSLEEAMSNKPTNQLKLAMPMLAQTFKGKIPNKFYLQYKYNGNRCLVYNNGKELIAYTRKGKRNNNLEHILEGIKIPVGVTLDGELYCHNTPLQTLRSWISRAQSDTKKIKYIVYDIIMNAPYSKRLEALESLTLGDSTTLALTRLLDRREALEIGGIAAELERAREEGYEGLIMRTDDTHYEDGKRSKSLLKIKKWQDKEFLVTNILTSADGWAILVCECEGKNFRVSCPGTIQFKKEVLNKKDEYIGKLVTVEYSELTKEGIPFHPVAIAFREEE